MTIIAEATNRAGKLVQVEDTGKMTNHPQFRGCPPVEDYRIHYVIIDGDRKNTSFLRDWEAKEFFFQACQEGCDQ